MKLINFFKSNLLRGLILTVTLVIVCLTGCSKTDNIAGPNQNFQVTFGISQMQGNNGGTQFLFKPSSDIKVSRVICRFAEQQFADTVTSGNPGYIFSKDSTYTIREYINVELGQMWQFNFSGSNTAGNSNYNVSSNYTVQ